MSEESPRLASNISMSDGREGPWRAQLQVRSQSDGNWVDDISVFVRTACSISILLATFGPSHDERLCSEVQHVRIVDPEISMYIK